MREYVTIHRATHEGHDTTVGRHCLIMASSHVAHDCVLGDHVIVINYAGLTGHITVEDRATIGGLTGIHPFSRIGTYAYIGGCSKVTQDVPPFVIADGAPAVARSVNVVGMRRGGIDAALAAAGAGRVPPALPLGRGPRLRGQAGAGGARRPSPGARGSSSSWRRPSAASSPGAGRAGRERAEAVEEGIS